MVEAMLWMCLGLINLRIDLLRSRPSLYLRGQLWRLVVGVPLSLAWVYLTLPALVPGVGHTVVLLPLTINALYTMLTVLVGRAKKDRATIWLTGLVFSAALLVSLYLNFLVVPHRAIDLRNVPTVTVSDVPAPVMNLEHIRLVPYENAQWRAQKVLGAMGAGFEVGHLNIQLVDGELYWVGLVDFRGLLRWLNFREAPGFIMVDAEDAGVPAEFVPFAMRYTPGAFFGSDLRRHIYRQHQAVLLLDPSFELDDDGNPRWVMSIGRPTVGKTGTVVTGIVILDPATGEMQEYAKADAPLWVDQVIPEFVAEQHNDWFGRFVHGYWNSLFTKRDMHLPTEWEGVSDVFGVVGPDARFYWFTGHTAAAGRDDSLMGYTMMDGRTGEITYYRYAVGFFNEAAAVSSVNAAVADFVGWHGAQPLLYNLYGAEAYVVPVLSDTNILKAVGIVNARTGRTIVEPTLLQAVLAYKQYLGQGIGGVVPTDVALLQSLEGEVLRVGAATTEGTTLFYFRLEGSNRIFTATATLSPHVALTQPGDRVAIAYLDTAEEVVPLATFRNLEMTRP